jgi:hypothetical protein
LQHFPRTGACPENIPDASVPDCGGCCFEIVEKGNRGSRSRSLSAF